MFKFLRYLLGLCNHEWKIIEEGKLMYGVEKKVVGKFYILQCLHCGTIKEKVVNLSYL